MNLSVTPGIVLVMFFAQLVSSSARRVESPFPDVLPSYADPIFTADRGPEAYRRLTTLSYDHVVARDM